MAYVIEDDSAREIERIRTPRGEIALRAAGEHHEIVADGTFLMDTRDGRSERLLVTAAAAASGCPRRVLIGGLGIGFSLRAALATGGVEQVTVVEVEPAIIRWHDGPLSQWSQGAIHDPRVEIVCADLLDWLRLDHQPYDVVCLDIDNGPEWTVRESNAWLYGTDGLRRLRDLLAPDGALGVWAAHRSEEFVAALSEQVGRVEVLEIPVPRGEPDVVYLAGACVADATVPS